MELAIDRIPAEGIQQRMVCLESELIAALRETIHSGQYLQGEAVRDLEERIQQDWGCQVAAATHSGTGSLQIALLAAGVKPGDEVIVPAISFISTSFAVNSVGAVPVFVDVDPMTLTIDPKAVRAVLSERTAAIIAVHLYGQMADMAPLAAIASEHGLKLIEDCAQAHGAKYDDRYAGSIGDFGCFSFYAGKNVGGIEDGGMVTANDEAVRETLMRLRDLGRLPGARYEHACWGMRARMGEFTARVIRKQLHHADHWLDKRREIAKLYLEALSASPLQLPRPALRRRHVYYKFTVVAPSSAARNCLETALGEAGVQVERIYPVMLPDQPAYRSGGLVFRTGDLPVSASAVERLTCLPIYPELTIDQVNRVIEATRGAVLR